MKVKESNKEGKEQEKRILDNDSIMHYNMQ